MKNLGYSLGSADMLDVAHMGVHEVPMTWQEAMAWAFESVTLNGTQAMGLPDPSLRVCGHASMVVLQANDRIKAVRLRATRLYVIRHGKVLSETPPRLGRFQLMSAAAKSIRRIMHHLRKTDTAGSLFATEGDEAV